MRIVITGVPGTGKTTIARWLARELDYELIEINALVKEKRLWSRKEHGGLIANMNKLKKALGKLPKDVIVEGHLACEFSLPVHYVFVLRTKPAILKKRLAKRAYSRQKIRENLLAEALDYCTIRSLEHYPNEMVYEIDTSLPLNKVKKVIKSILFGNRSKIKRKEINWHKELLKLALEGDVKRKVYKQLKK